MKRTLSSLHGYPASQRKILNAYVRSYACSRRFRIPCYRSFQTKLATAVGIEPTSSVLEAEALPLGDTAL
jgi:hypothetical protein